MSYSLIFCRETEDNFSQFFTFFGTYIVTGEWNVILTLGDLTKGAKLEQWY